MEEGLRTAFELWAKTDRQSDRWHALPYHLIDVGAAASQLWDRLPSCSRRVAVLAFGDEQIAKKYCVFLASIHDLGKVNRFFQAKAPAQVGRLAHLGVERSPEKKKHGQATTALLEPWIKDCWGWSQEAAASVSVAVGGHHGVFINDSKTQSLDLDAGYVPAASAALLNSIGELWIADSATPSRMGIGT